MSASRPEQNPQNAKPAADIEGRRATGNEALVLWDFFVGVLSFTGALVVPAASSVSLINFQAVDQFLVRCGLVVLQFPIGMLLFLLPLGLPVIATGLVFRWRKRVKAPPHKTLHIQFIVGATIGLVWLYFRVMAAAYVLINS